MRSNAKKIDLHSSAEKEDHSQQLKQLLIKASVFNYLDPSKQVVEGEEKV